VNSVVRKAGNSRTALALLAPALIIGMLMFGSNSGGVGVASAKSTKTKAPKTGPTPASVQVGFITEPVAGSSPIALTGYQNIYLNVVAVRLNPKPKPNSTATPSPNDPNWVTIPVPSGIIGNAGNTGALQIDLIAGQTEAQLFNTAGVRVNTYHTAELLLDTQNPGEIVPVCGSAPSRNDGCVTQPIQLSDAGALEFSLGAGLTTSKNILAQLLIGLQFQITGQPTFPGAPYTVQVAAEELSNVDSYFATVSGNVEGTNGQKKPNKVGKLTVTAELAGTGNVVAIAPVSFKSGSTPNYTLSLPAPPPPPGSPSGAYYDIYVSGGQATFEAARLPGLFAGDAITQGFKVKGGQTLGNISGRLTSQCGSLGPIPGATVELLLPPDENLSADCVASPQDCVVIGTTGIDSNGYFPLPGTVKAPSPFNIVPIAQPSGSAMAGLAIEVTAPGYDSMMASATAQSKSKGGICIAPTAMSASVAAAAPTATPTPQGCSFKLGTGLITGQVQLSNPTGNPVLYQVFAEDSGTNHLESALPMPVIIRPGVQTANFTLNVPTSDVVPTLDLFAEAIDLYQGNTNPYPGHTIAVVSGVPAPPRAVPSPGMPAPACETVAPQEVNPMPAMDCAGHGSITGIVVNPDVGTSVELFKLDASNNPVALTSSSPQVPPTIVGGSNVYSLCVPPDDSYDVQRFEVPSPGASPTPTGDLVAVGAMATPMATSSGCPTSCSDNSGGTLTCPGICSNSSGPPL
jgi:hypothetical protein